MQTSNTRKRAFTLIELLVVISIIALLVSILLPALGAARKTAIELQCLTQLRSLGQATHMYTADNSLYYPQSLNTTWAHNDGGGWTTYHATLNTYMGMAENWNTTARADQYHCPAIWDEATVAAWGDPGYGSWALYGANPHIMPYGNGVNGQQYNSGSYSRYPGQVKYMKEADNSEPPSTFAMMYDCYRFQSWWPGLAARTYYSQVSHIFMPHFTRELLEFRTSAPYAGDMTAGGGRGSIVYADGHANGRIATDWNNAGDSARSYIDSWTLSE
jgi:prepilin-type N-terminal cleavage/methylation domain-containing protein